MTDAITMDVEVKKYTAKSGAPFPAAKAQEVGESLEEIQMKYGKLRPKLVVQEAEDDQHELHPYFDWEDEKAAMKWRLQQAMM